MDLPKAIANKFTEGEHGDLWEIIYNKMDEAQAIHGNAGWYAYEDEQRPGQVLWACDNATHPPPHTPIFKLDSAFVDASAVCGCHYGDTGATAP